MQHGSTGGEDLRRKAESTAATVAEQAQQTAEVHLSSQKNQAASTLHTLAETIRDGGPRMRDEQPQIASLADQAAGKIDEASSYIRQHDVRDFVREAENFARREPLIFLGGAFAVGFLAARFLKSSSPGGNGRGGQQDLGGGRDRYALGQGYGGSGLAEESGYARESGYAGASGTDTFVGGARSGQALSGSTSRRDEV